MKIILLTRNRFLYSSRRLIKAARAAGHEIQIVNPLGATLGLTKSGPVVSYQGDPLVGDVVIPRIGQGITDHGIAVVRQFELCKVPTINGSDAIATSRDKIRSLQALVAHGLPIPPSVICNNAADIEPAINMLGGLPVVAKTAQGTQGVGVMLLESMTTVRSVLETMWSMSQKMVIQKFITESAGRDIRVIVMGGKVVATMRRISKDGEFRSNIHRGATGENVSLTKEDAAVALRATAAAGLTVAGVDILETNEGPMVIEVNSTPGLEGIETVTGVDVASKFIEFTERHVIAEKERDLASAHAIPALTGPEA